MPTGGQAHVAIPVWIQLRHAKTLRVNLEGIFFKHLIAHTSCEDYLWKFKINSVKR